MCLAAGEQGCPCWHCLGDLAFGFWEAIVRLFFQEGGHCSDHKQLWFIPSGLKTLLYFQAHPVLLPPPDLAQGHKLAGLWPLGVGGAMLLYSARECHLQPTPQILQCPITLAWVCVAPLML